MGVGSDPTLLELSGERVLHRGKDVEREQTLTLRPRTWHDYVLTEENEGSGQSVTVSVADRRVQVTADRFGTYPIYFHVSRGLVLVDPSVSRIVRRLTELERAPTVDRVGYIEGLLLDCALRDRTLYDQVKQVMAGETVALSAASGESKRIALTTVPFDLSGGLNYDREDLLEKAVEVLSDVGMAFVDQVRGKRVLLPLSGGYDSRLLLGFAVREGIDFSAVSFGTRESNDLKVAVKIAALAGITTRQYILEPQMYEEAGRQLTSLTGGMTTAMHCHLFGVLSRHAAPYDVIAHGYAGDAYAGAYQPSVKGDLHESRDSALQRFVASRLSKSFVWRQLPPDDRDAIEHDLDLMMDDCCVQGRPCHFEEYVYSVDQLFSLIANSFAPIELLAPLVRPYASPRFVDFFNALPFELREGRVLFRQAARRIFPDLYSVGNQVSYTLGDRPHLAKLIRRANLAAYSSIYLASRGKVTLPTPYVFEKHQELLDGHLKGEYQAALSYGEELFGLDLTKYRSPTLTRFLEGRGAYRVLSSYWALTERSAARAEPAFA